MSWLYLAKRSDLENEPVLIWPVFRATDKSAIVVSSVSPDLWDTTQEYLFCKARLMTLIVSVKVPIWLGFMRIEFAYGIG